MTMKKSSPSASSGANGQAPEHIKQGWINFAAAMQKALAEEGGKGFTCLTVRVAVLDLDVEGWMPPKIERISPLSLAKAGLSDKNAFIIMGMLGAE